MRISTGTTGRLLAMIITALPLLAKAQERISIIPKPVNVTAQEGSFLLNGETKIYSHPAFTAVAALFAEQAGQATAKVITLKNGGASAGNNSVPLVQSGNNSAGNNIQSGNNSISFVQSGNIAGKEGYQLNIRPQAITLAAATPAGALRGAASLLQLILLQPETGRRMYVAGTSTVNIPCAAITDSARFGWRGMHMDVSRHFYPLSFVKKFIDLMALYKMNTFHWHLTDGAGWRLEIKQYPALTEMAAWRSTGNWKQWWNGNRLYSREGAPNAYGGYYTQEEAKELVAYAKRRGITVIPEVEMPGHSEEVLAAYPELSCSGLPYRNAEFCLGNDSTYTFLENVLKEVMDIFPSTYIHIGGDEADKKAWKQCPKCQQRIKTARLKDEHELQSYAVRRMEKFLVAHNRKLLGWDEILEGGLAPQATVMSWRGEEGGIAAAREQHDVVMTPGAYCYFDSYQADPATEPETIGGFLPLSKVYSYEPIPAALDSIAARHVLGAQGTLWAEYMNTSYQMEYMAFPRLLALSEVIWSPRAQRNWEDFHTRLQQHYGLLQRSQVNYYRPSYQVNITTTVDTIAKETQVQFSSEQYKPVIRYTLDGSTPTAASPVYNGPFAVKGRATVKAAVFSDTLLQGKPASWPVDYHKAIGKKVIYNLPYSKGYKAQEEATFVNGQRGSLTYGDGQWQAFGGDMDITIDMGQAVPLQEIIVSFMQLTGPGVFMPAWVEVSLSTNGKQFSSPQRVNNEVPVTQDRLTLKDFNIGLKAATARYIRIKARNSQGGFIFADEVIVH